MNKVTTAILALLAISGIAAVTLFADPERTPPVLKSGVVLEPPVELPEFQLRDQHGKRFTRSSLEGRWHLVFPGFTHCPDICPTTLATLHRVHSLLGPHARQLRVVLLTVDPERDTPQALSRYLDHFNPAFLGVTGEQEQLDRLYEALGVNHIRIPGAAGEYSVDHSAALLLIDPAARLAGYFRPPLGAGKLAEDLKPVLQI